MFSQAVLIGRGLDQANLVLADGSFHCSILKARKVLSQSGAKPQAQCAATYAPLAQLVEQLTLNQRVPGSSP